MSDYQAPQTTAPYTAPTSMPTPITTTTKGNFLGLSVTTWIIIIILVLAILGINIFIYIKKGSQSFSDFLKPYVGDLSSFFGHDTSDNDETTQASINSKFAKNPTINSDPDSTTNSSQEINGHNAKSSLINTDSSNNSVPTQSQVNASEDTELTNTLNNATPENGEPESYNSDDSGGAIQPRKTSGKAGWCYIGEERGYRSCSQVGANDTCMSGDIFPSQEICVNPTLRP
jgi:hypothetical protein